MTIRNKPALILETHLDKDKLTISLYEQGATVHPYEEVPFSFEDVRRLSADISRIIHKFCEMGKHSDGFCAELKQRGQALYQMLLSAKVKEVLLRTGNADVQIILDEGLVFIPWELLYDGQQFFCLKFNLGRGVKTRRPSNALEYRKVKRPAGMLVMADPCGTLPSARKEAAVIRDQFPGNRPAMQISTKTKDVTLSFIQKNLREYDVIHFAGHTRYESGDTGKSGWIMRDGTLTIEDIKKAPAGNPMPALIFSNSCQSAYDAADVYHAQTEEQVFGLADAFLLSGVRFFLGTLWKISDEDSAAFARAFYRYISEGSTIGYALRQSRLESLEKLGEDNMVWASYILYGEPNRPILSDPSPFPGKQIMVRLAKRSPLVIGIFLAVFSGILMFVNRTALSAANIEKERSIVRQKYQTKGLGEAFTYIRETKQGRSLRNQYLMNILLADAYALSFDYEQSLEAAQNALNVADKMHNKQRVEQAAFFLADKIKEKSLHLAVFFPEKSIPDKEFLRAVQLYESLAAGQDQLSKQAYAYKGVADLYKIKNERHHALGYYQKAVEALGKKRDMDLQERVHLANIHIDMARLYIEGDRDFEKALDHLEGIDGLMRASSGHEPFSSFDRNILVNKFQLLLQHLADTGFKNSSFYKKAEEQYHRL